MVRAAELGSYVAKGDTTTVEKILQSNPKVVENLNTPERHNGWTQLFRAVEYGHPEVVRLLRRYGAKAGVKCGKGNMEGKTPMGVAKTGDLDIHIVMETIPKEFEALKVELIRSLRCKVNPVSDSR